MSSELNNVIEEIGTPLLAEKNHNICKGYLEFKENDDNIISIKTLQFKGDKQSKHVIDFLYLMSENKIEQIERIYPYLKVIFRILDSMYTVISVSNVSLFFSRWLSQGDYQTLFEVAERKESITKTYSGIILGGGIGIILFVSKSGYSVYCDATKKTKETEELRSLSKLDYLRLDAQNTFELNKPRLKQDKEICQCLERKYTESVTKVLKKLGYIDDAMALSYQYIEHGSSHYYAEGRALASAVKDSVSNTVGFYDWLKTASLMLGGCFLNLSWPIILSLYTLFLVGYSTSRLGVHIVEEYYQAIKITFYQKENLQRRLLRPEVFADNNFKQTFHELVEHTKFQALTEKFLLDADYHSLMFQAELFEFLQAVSNTDQASLELQIIEFINTKLAPIMGISKGHTLHSYSNYTARKRENGVSINIEPYIYSTSPRALASHRI